ncbi:MAG: aldehyde dehydrogenase [Microscillaceae bacterium]
MLETQVAPQAQLADHSTPKPKINTGLAVQHLLRQQQNFFKSGQTRSVAFRLAQLRKLKWLLKDHEGAFFAALQQDFQKPAWETYTTELALVLQEIETMRDHLYRWASPQTVADSLINFPAYNQIYPEPYGVALIIGAWNYPLQLTLLPLVGAIAAGNCAVVKPSELAPHTSALLARLFTLTFAPEYLSIVEGGPETAQLLLAEKWDYIFFTGSTRVGRIVAQAAALHLTPVTLELGGKNPCVIDETASIELAARRIAWGKFINAGQTCVAPDYVWIHRSQKEDFIKELRRQLRLFYGDNPLNSPDYARIIDDAHFARLSALIEGGEVRIGGQTQSHERYIAPTVIEEQDWQSPRMREEIFGPILPVLVFDDWSEVMPRLQNLPKPLALYLFSHHPRRVETLLDSLAFGGACVNDTLSQLVNERLPFGGVGSSGMGAYHGKASFDTFTHYKSVLKKATWLDIPLRYAPYQGKLELTKWFFWLAR